MYAERREKQLFFVPHHPPLSSPNALTKASISNQPNTPAACRVFYKAQRKRGIVH
eukprot:COSAG06_NODE_454_length_15536_cov_23.174257_18_plen_55_part_00